MTAAAEGVLLTELQFSVGAVVVVVAAAPVGFVVAVVLDGPPVAVAVAFDASEILELACDICCCIGRS